MPTTVAMAQYVGSITADNQTALAKIDRPTLLLFSDEMKSTMEAMHDRIRGSRLEAFPGAGHALFVDQADHFDAVLEAFAASLHDGAAGRGCRPRPASQ